MTHSKKMTQALKNIGQMVKNKDHRPARISSSRTSLALYDNVIKSSIR